MQDTTQEFDLYIAGRDYNNKLSPPYYPTISRNFRFYSNDQWNGVKSNGLPTPVFNILKQIIDYKIAAMSTNRTKMQFTIENIADATEDAGEQELKKYADIISGYAEQKWEKLKMDSVLREILVDGANSGDFCAYTYWEPTIDTGSTNGIDKDGNPVKVMGDFVTEAVDGSNVMFGNPNSNKVQTQPYILIAGRKLVSELRKQAKLNKRPQEEIEKITGDNDYEEQSGDRGKIELETSGSDSSKCLYLIKLWKEEGKVYMKIVTKSAVIQDKTDTGLTLYPIAWGNWDLLKNSYHGQAEVTGLIPNQILINQMFAMMAYHMRMSAFGKVVYDKTRISAWNNAIGAAIGVEGDVQNVVKQLEPGQLNTFVMTLIEKAIELTKDIAGVNDAALGNMSPRNTSAIVALQKQAAIPLESVKDRVYQFIEDLGLIWLDFIVNKYDVSRLVSYTQDNQVKTGTFTGSNFKEVPFKVRIDVGNGDFWSETASINTLDNLLQGDKINMVQYLERLPNGVINKKTELIKELKAQAEQKQPEPDLPKFTVNYADMPTMAQLQLLAKAGIQVQPQDMPQVQNEQMQKTTEQLGAQTQQLEDAHKQLTYEQMAQFMQTLSPQVQEELKKLPDAQMEEAVQQLMAANKQGMMQPQPSM